MNRPFASSKDIRIIVYAVHDEDRSEWLGFLGLLEKHRPKARINGIVIVASIAELSGNRPDATIKLAKQLRRRVQELPKRLELLAPVYIMFTKVDLIAGFVDFFGDSDAGERSRVGGAALPYDTGEKVNVVRCSTGISIPWATASRSSATLACPSIGARR